MDRADHIGIGDDALGLPDDSADIILGGNLKNGIHSPKIDPMNRRPSGAPKRFKSSFIFFSMEKHKEIKDRLQKEGSLNHMGDSSKSPPQSKNITKLVSEAWRSLTPLEKKKYEDMAAEDKMRYDQESAAYKSEKGPNALSKKRPKDPNLPKRPMSAFLAFANSRRAETKANNPDCTNGEISKLLSSKWKEAPESVKQKYREEEAELWATYKEQMADYRKKNDGRKKSKTMDFKKVKVTKAKSNKKSKPSSTNHKTFDNDSLSDESFDVPNFGSFGAQGIEQGMNASQDDIMAASAALRGVRSSGPGMLQLGGGGGGGSGNGGGAGGLGGGFGNGGGLMGLDLGGLQQNLQQGTGGSLGALLGNNPMASIGGGLSNGLSNSNSNSQQNPNGLGQGGLGQDLGGPGGANRALLEMGLPFQQYGSLLGNNSQAMLMAQAAALRPGSFLGFGDQQPPLSQLASLAGGQNGMGGLGGPAPGGMSSGLNLGSLGLGGLGGGFGGIGGGFSGNIGGGLNVNGLMNDNSNNRFSSDGANGGNF